ncbi:MAG TPA: chitobiase/beta-hexosaminidase C-terminal domain-containing protein [Verrucomicrobiae bacterium]
MIVNFQGRRWSVVWLLLASILYSGPTLAQTLHPRDHAVELTAEIRKDPPQIVLKWRGDQYARNYTINRKSRNAGQWTKVGNAAGHETWFADSNVAVGNSYEYQVVKEGTLQYMGYGYIYAGIEVPLIEDRGSIILLVESSIAPALEFELKRLEFDLTGDGWRVIRHDVSRRAKVPEVKALIQSIYYEDPANTRALFLFGNIPVPYSGNITPDEHDNHLGAWPADVYYGDIDGTWTDSTLTSTGAEKGWNHNVPGDGKFDQSEVPSAVELQVGRVDLSRMTCFSNKTPSRSEVDLLRLYLEKDHAFRHGRLPTDPRALIYDLIGDSEPEPLATMAWRNFAPFVGSSIDLAKYGEYIPKTAQQTYLWSSTVAGGSFTSAGGIGPSDVFATATINAVFTMFCGSYYGDWDNESNFLRATLGANGRVLASLYSGQPQWLCQTMALGEPIGAATKLTQENGPNGIYLPHNRGAGQIHVSLHGDPTLRAHPVPSPGNLQASARPDGLLLTWDPSTYSNIAGYTIFERDSSTASFRRITDSPINGTSYLVLRGQTNRTYMVRALALTTSPSGSYWNASQGALYPDPLVRPSAVPAAPRDLVVANKQSGQVHLRWISASADSWNFEIERRDPGAAAFHRIANRSREQLDYLDTTVGSQGAYAYRVRALNPVGGSDYSNIVVANMTPATAEFLGEDRFTQGRWIGRYGSGGAILPTVLNSFPPFTTLMSSNAGTPPGGFSADARGLQVPNSDLYSFTRWMNFDPWALTLTFPDDNLHQVAFYFISGPRSDPSFDIEVYDPVSRKLLDRRTYEDINEGVYVIYNVRRGMTLRIVPPWLTVVEVIGVFLDDPRIQPVRIEPPGGSFAGKTLVTMSTPTTGTTISFTTDGSEPTLNSPRYTEPFWIFSNTRLRARAFRDGYPPSPITDVDFQNGITSGTSLLGWDQSASGNWVAKFGTEGFQIPNGASAVPAYAQVSGLPAAWVWADSTSDSRAPFRDRAAASRVASGWYGDEMNIDLGVFDTRRRAVALYFLDWDGKNRVTQVEVLDSAGVVRDSYIVENFASGKYLVLGIQGLATLRLKTIAGPNVVLSGIFFDPAPVQVNVGAPVPFRNFRAANGTLSFTATGLADQRFCLDTSSNLQQWTCLTTNTFSAPELHLQVPVKRAITHEFLRGHFVP